ARAVAKLEETTMTEAHRYRCRVTEVWTNMPLCEVITDAVKEYLDRTATAHDCPGVGCSLCVVDGWRYAELSSIIFFLLEEKGIPWTVRVTPAENPRNQAAMTKEEAIALWKLMIRCYGLHWTGYPSGWRWIHSPSREAQDCLDEISKVLTPAEKRYIHERLSE